MYNLTGDFLSTSFRPLIPRFLHPCCLPQQRWSGKVGLKHTATQSIAVALGPTISLCPLGSRKLPTSRQLWPFISLPIATRVTTSSLSSITLPDTNSFLYLLAPSIPLVKMSVPAFSDIAKPANDVCVFSPGSCHGRLLLGLRCTGLNGFFLTSSTTRPNAMIFAQRAHC